MPSIENPDSWPEFAQVDPEFAQLLKNQTTPRLTRGSDFPSTRLIWNPIFEDEAATLLSETNGAVTVETIQIPLSNGSTARSLVYRPAKPTGPSPLVLFFHGGGFCLGSAEMESVNCINAAHHLNSVALTVDYALAPETKFPHMHYDCWDVLQWVATNATELGANPTSGFIVGGTSAGGNLAAALVHQAMSKNLKPSVTGVHLNVAGLLGEEAVPDKYASLYRSREQQNNAPLLNSKSSSAYLSALQPDPLSPLYSPFLSLSEQKSHPPTYFQICGQDMLRDEDLLYERVLRTELGIKTKVDIYPGLPHVFWLNFPTHSVSKRYPLDAEQGLHWLLNEAGNE